MESFAPPRSVFRKADKMKVVAIVVENGPVANNYRQAGDTNARIFVSPEENLAEP